MRKEWDSFKKACGKREINVRDFILKNYTPSRGDDSFLADATQDTLDLWDQVLKLSEEERKKAESWIWTPRSFLPLLHMAQDIWTSQGKDCGIPDRQAV